MVGRRGGGPEEMMMMKNMGEVGSQCKVIKSVIKCPLKFEKMEGRHILARFLKGLKSEDPDVLATFTELDELRELN